MIDKHAKIYQVYKGKELLSMMIFGIYKNSAIYWTNACSLNGLKYGANYFGIWEVIKKFKKMKLSFFELGEAFESSINKKKLGLNHFKKGFGCKSYPYYKSEIIKNKYKDLFETYVLRVFPEVLFHMVTARSYPLLAIRRSYLMQMDFPHCNGVWLGMCISSAKTKREDNNCASRWGMHSSGHVLFMVTVSFTPCLQMNNILPGCFD